MNPQGSSTPGQQLPQAHAAIERMLQRRQVAIVGLSDDPVKPSYEVARYLIEHGYEVIPVNPTRPTLLGKKSYKSLAELAAPPEVVLVFRRPEHCGQVAREAIAAGAKGLWLQQGIRNEEARKLAEEAKIDFVEDRCMMVEHRRLEREAAN